MPPKPVKPAAAAPAPAPAPAPPTAAPEVSESVAAAEPVVDERKLRVKAAFSIFDPEGTGMVVEEEIPTIMRYLDIFVPDKEFIDRILPDLHGDEPSTFIKYEKFEDVCIKLMDAHEFQPDGEEVLLAAFKALDPEGKGYIDVETMKALMTDHGDPPFREKELEAFLKIAVDKNAGKIFYEDYIALMSR